MSTILIVDDEKNIRELIKKYAHFDGYTVVEGQNGLEAIDLCRDQAFDLIIMDVMMPELDGFSAVKEIRKKCDTPIIMLSARGEEYDKIHGFTLEVDDYVVKPFSPKELMMRIATILKRGKRLTKHDVYKTDELVADFTARKIIIGESEIDLSPKEYELVFYLIRNKNIALTRDQIINDVWGYDFFGDDRTLDTHIKLLRKSLGEYSKLITTLRGVGYRFEG